MTRLWTWCRTLAPVAQGFLGALLAAVLCYAGWWTYTRYTEFVIMRTVIGQIIENSQKQQAAQKQAEKP